MKRWWFFKPLFLVSFLFFIVFLNGCAARPQIFKIENITVEIVLNPSAPKVGENDMKIKLIDGRGKPIKNAMVHINYGMSAMGSMPAMFAEVRSEMHKDTYHAGLSLSMDGTWNLKMEIHVPDQPRITLNFSLTTGIKGIMLKSGAAETMGEEDRGAMENGLSISKEEGKLVGVETSLVTFRRLMKEIKTVGNVAYDPDLYVAQEEFISALKLDEEELISMAKKKLQILGMSDSQVEALENNGRIQSNLILPGNQAFIYAAVYEYEYALVKEGQKVEITSQAYPGEIFTGKVVSIPSILDPMTRSVKIKIEVENPAQKLKPEMFVDVVFRINLGEKLSVPEEAIINTGERSIVVVVDNQGNYVSRDVQVGEKAQGYSVIIKGLRAGEKVVTAGNFLIDSESRLRSAVKGGPASPAGGHQH